jgi:hypothetical protein
VLGLVAVLVLCKLKIPALKIGPILRGELIPQECSLGAFLPAWWRFIARPY